MTFRHHKCDNVILSKNNDIKILGCGLEVGNLHKNNYTLSNFSSPQAKYNERFDFKKMMFG